MAAKQYCERGGWTRCMSGHSTYVDPTIFDARLTIHVAAFIVSNGKRIHR